MDTATLLNTPTGFQDLAFLFSCDNRNRGILRMNFDEAALLWSAACASSGDLLEIGRRHGGSTVLLALATRDRKITSIDFAPDHATPVEAFFERPEVLPRLELLVTDSRKSIPNRRFGFLFIDGDHSFEGVLSDVEAHWNSLQGDSRLLCVFHDAVPNLGRHPGPEGVRAVAEASKAHSDDFRLTNHFIGIEFTCHALVTQGCARRVESAGSLLVLEKCADLPPGFGANVRRDFPLWKSGTL